MNIKRYEMEGYEADDIIGTLAKTAEEKGYHVVIVTGDRDTLQLASENVTIKLPVTSRGKTETQIYNPETIRGKYQSTPEALIDIKGLMGDSSDNIPGVPGVGEKTAISLISEYGSIEGVYENIENISRKALKEKLINNKDLAFLSRRLATINTSVPLKWDPEAIKVKEIDKQALRSIFERLEFKSFISRYGLEDVDFSPGDEGVQKVELLEIKRQFDVRTTEELSEFKKQVLDEIGKTEKEKHLTISVAGEITLNKMPFIKG